MFRIHLKLNVYLGKRLTEMYLASIATEQNYNNFIFIEVECFSCQDFCLLHGKTVTEKFDFFQQFEVYDKSFLEVNH